MTGSWRDRWEDHAFVFDLPPGGLRAEGTTPIRFDAATSGGVPSATGYFRYRPEGHEDSELGRVFDVVVLSNLEIFEGFRRIGLGSAVVAAIARHFPDALIVGENANEDAQAWHKRSLEVRMPTRMLDVLSGGEVRITPGVSIDQSEVE